MALVAGWVLRTEAQSLQEKLGDLAIGARWKYNDWESARNAARLSGKPILALFRCVP